MARVTHEEFLEATAERKAAMAKSYKILAKYYRERLCDRNKAIISKMKESGCLDCGEKDLIVLEFDHRDPTMKSFSISDQGHTVSLKRLYAELDKCDVVCANDHRRRTAKYYGWGKTA